MLQKIIISMLAIQPHYFIKRTICTLVQTKLKVVKGVLMVALLLCHLEWNKINKAYVLCTFGYY